MGRTRSMLCINADNRINEFHQSSLIVLRAKLQLPVFRFAKTPSQLPVTSQSPSINISEFEMQSNFVSLWKQFYCDLPCVQSAAICLLFLSKCSTWHPAIPSPSRWRSEAATGTFASHFEWKSFGSHPIPSQVSQKNRTIMINI